MLGLNRPSSEQEREAKLALRKALKVSPRDSTARWV